MPGDSFHKLPVKTIIARHFRMKTQCEHLSRVNGNNPPISQRRANSHTVADSGHNRGPNERHVNRPTFHTGHVERNVEGLALTPEGISTHRHIHRPEGLLPGNTVFKIGGEHDHSGAGAKDRKTLCDESLERFPKAKEPRELIDHRRLTARQDKALDAREVGRLSYLDDSRPQRLEHATVLTHIALQGENTDQR